MKIRLANIHETLAEQRKKLGISQQEVADALHVEQTSISHYETAQRRVPIEILDAWLAMLDIEVTITPKGYEAAKDEELTQKDLEAFLAAKRRRNLLIAELRSMMARRVMQEPFFQREYENSGESAFWPFALHADHRIGLLENRCDHPSQRNLAVVITDEDASVHRLSPDVAPAPVRAGRSYMTETDFLTIGSQLGHEELEELKSTLLRTSRETPGGTALVSAEGFALGSLLEMQASLAEFAGLCKEVAEREDYRAMEAELLQVEGRLSMLEYDNRLANGTPNPAFRLWTTADQSAVDVPLYSPDRVWRWAEEGVSWTEEIEYEEPGATENE